MRRPVHGQEDSGLSPTRAYTRRVYELTITREFCAAHAIVMQGQREALHGHNWVVRVVVRAPKVDADGLVCDFHALEKSLAAVIGAWNNQNLNETAPFDQLNPTAEHVAREIASRMQQATPTSAKIHRVSVTEAPGCEATFLPSES